MAVMTRVNIIAEAKSRVGRKAQSLNLAYVYDGITAWISTRYPVIQAQRTTGNCTAAQSYITPPDVVIRRPLKFQIGSTGGANLSDIRPVEPEEFITYKGASNAAPTLWTYMRDQTTPFTSKLIYLYATPDDTYAYAFYYQVINAKSTGDSYQHSMTEYMDPAVILGVMYKAAILTKEYSKAWKYKQLFRKEARERAYAIIKDFKTVEL